jgi:AbrB family looped-hinge helix DNA binding protein
MRVTTKGQVTIPREIRKKMNITPASEVDFIVGEDGRVCFVKVEESRDTISPKFSILRGVATVKMVTEEIMTLTRTDA